MTTGMPSRRCGVGADRGRRVLRLRADERELGTRLQRLGGGDARGVDAPAAVEPEPRLADRGELLAAGGDLDEVTDPVEECRDRAADGPCPDHADTHALQPNRAATRSIGRNTPFPRETACCVHGWAVSRPGPGPARRRPARRRRLRRARSARPRHRRCGPRCGPAARQREADQRGEPQHAGADPHGRDGRIHVAGRGERPARAGEHRRQHRDAERDADLAQGRVGAGRLRVVRRAHVREHRGRARREDETHADARRAGTAATSASTGRVGGEGAGDPAHRDGEEHEPGDDRQARARARRQQPGERRDDHRRERPRHGHDAGLERGVALHHLQELDQDEDRPEDAEAEGDADQVRDGEAAVAEQPQRQQGSGRARLPEHERDQQGALRRSAGCSTSALSQPASLPRTMP